MSPHEWRPLNIGRSIACSRMFTIFDDPLDAVVEAVVKRLRHVRQLKPPVRDPLLLDADDAQRLNTSHTTGRLRGSSQHALLEVERRHRRDERRLLRPVDATAADDVVTDSIPDGDHAV